MAVRVHWGDASPFNAPHGGTWQVADTAGGVHVKWGGSTWQTPAFMRYKWGGGWVDTGYRGYPATPSTPWVSQWDYNNVSIAWNAGAGGAPVAAYQIVQTDSNGNWMYQYEVGGAPSPWGWFPVGPGGYYQYYVRAKGTSGLYSPFTSPVRVFIGQPSQYYETTENGTRGWSSYVDSAGWGYKDNLVGAGVPGSVLVSQIHWDLGCPFGVISPFNNRYTEIILNESYVYESPCNWQSKEIHGDDYPNFWGNSGRTGFICRGSGWSTYYNGPYRVWGGFTVYGTEYYQYQQGHWTAATGNGYW